MHGAVTLINGLRVGTVSPWSCMDCGIYAPTLNFVLSSFGKLLPLIHGSSYNHHDDVIKWKYFPRYRPFVRGIHRSPVNSPHKGQWRGALVFSLICALNKRLSKQSGGWWFETPSCPLCRHCNDRTIVVSRYCTVYDTTILHSALRLQILNICILTWNFQKTPYVSPWDMGGCCEYLWKSTVL